MVFGVDPRKLAAMQKVSKFIKAKITVDYVENRVELAFSSEDPEAVKLISSLLEQFSGGLAQQLSSFFAIDGVITEVGKPDEKAPA